VLNDLPRTSSCGSSLPSVLLTVFQSLAPAAASPTRSSIPNSSTWCRAAGGPGDFRGRYRQGRQDEWRALHTFSPETDNTALIVN